MLAIDVGNSAIKLAWPQVEENCEKLGFERFLLREADWPQRICQRLESLNEDRSAGRRLTYWCSASVNRPASERLRKTIGNRFPDHSWKELSRSELHLPLDIRNPETVGIDRLLGAFGAMNATNRQTVISVDAGSAVTVDLVREGRFAGGAILPGIDMQLSVLCHATDSLPSVQAADFENIEIPGRDTVAAMRCGVLLGVAAAIERLIEEYTKGEILNGNGLEIPVVFTGGDGAMLVPVLKSQVLHRPLLIHEAILETALTAGTAFAKDVGKTFAKR